MRRVLRRRARLSQAELAVALGVSQAAALLSRWHDEYRFRWLVLETNAAKYFIADSEFLDWLKATDVRLIEHKTAGNKGDERYGEGTIPADIEAGRVRIPYGDELARRKFSVLIHELLEEISTTDCRMALWFPKWHLPGLASLRLEGDRPSLLHRAREVAAPPPRLMPDRPEGIVLHAGAALMRKAGLP